MSYCVKCRSKTNYREKPNLVQTKNKRYAVVGNCNKCGIKKQRALVNKMFKKGVGCCQC